MKEWRDWFYFSAGERRALSVLTLLIIATWIALWITHSEAEREAEAQATEASMPRDTIRNRIAPIQDTIPQSVAKPEPRTTPKANAARTFAKPFKSEKKRYVSDKFPKGTVVELNGADSLTLRKVPGIGEAFSRRIIKYRDLLGGFYTVTQLAEVYGIDEERYAALAPWFIADTTQIRPIAVNHADFRTLIRHPYLNKQQTVTLLNLVKRKGRLSGWSDLRLLEEFTPEERERLRFYLSFE